MSCKAFTVFMLIIKGDLELSEWLNTMRRNLKIEILIWKKNNCKLSSVSDVPIKWKK